MAPFIRRVRTASGATGVQIMEKQGRKNVVLKHVGSARNEVELAALMQAAHDELHPGQTTLDFDPKRRHATSVLRVGGKRSALLWSVLNKAYADVGFDVLGDEAFKQMVLARLVEP